MAERRPSALHVVYADVHIATLREHRRRGTIECRYTTEALERWPGNTPLLSCSLPLGTRPLDATPFLEGLLPEGEARAIIAADRGVAATDVYLLLAFLGRDVAGALSVWPDDDQDFHRPSDVVPYGDREFEAAVAGLPRAPLDLHDDSELSLAGIQNKMTLVALGGGRWGRPVGGTPSTHILKAEDRRFPGLCRYEEAALRLGRHVGLTSVDTEAVTLGDIDCLIVSRFDRVPDANGVVRRVHQEDLCQAVGYDPTVRRKGKYERHGAPGFVRAAELLRRWSPPDQREQLVRAMVFTVVIGNADAHAKNLALLHPTPGRIELAPLYDTVPTVCFAVLPRGLAMTVNAVFDDIESVTFADLVEETVGRRRWGVGRDRATELVGTTLVELTEAATTLALPDRFADYVARRSKALLAQQPEAV